MSLPELAAANLAQEGRSAGYLLLPPGSPCNNYQVILQFLHLKIDNSGILRHFPEMPFCGLQRAIGTLEEFAIQPRDNQGVHTIGQGEWQSEI